MTEQGETPLLMSRCQSQATIWAVSDKPALLRKLAILRGVTPTYFPHLDKQGDIATQLIHLLRKPAQEKKSPRFWSLNWNRSKGLVTSTCADY